VTQRTPSDADERARALDVRASYIVQAPAGSGKTELITQRMLALLAAAEAPEEVVAITFTRKAAAEMRNRLLERLEAADVVRHGLAEAPSEDNALTTHRLARAALERDAALDWGLLRHPARLRVQTIDSLCATLVARMPVLARLGGRLRPADDAGERYAQAAHETLAALEAGDGEGAEVRALQLVLRHLDNDLGQLARLIAQMLARRDQWLPHLNALGGQDEVAVRGELEDLLAELATTRLAATAAALGPGFQPTLMPLARHAAECLAAEGKADAAICRLAQWTAPLAGTPDEAGEWLAIADLCLTQDGAARRKLDKNCGFPTTGKAQKADMQALLDSLSVEQVEALAALRRLPPVAYSELQWSVLSALLVVLRAAAARLWLQFLAAGEVDFAEVQSRALLALGTPDAPTDLALALDYRIRHLLVDEFQDTSGTQWELLRRLTAGWEAGDGRTLLLVGDPMQSIYLFRQAEVGLFIQAREQGLGGVALTPLTLRANFRSQQGIVDWVNQGFARIFPRAADPLSGAVPVSPAEAVKPALDGPAVAAHPFITGQRYDPASLEALGADAGTSAGLSAREAEAQRVLHIIADTLADDAAASIAILVRSRSHLDAIAPALRAAGMPFQAVEIDALAERQYIADLLSLTRALLLPADRVHWLALLRAEWCGLTLNDLFALCADEWITPLPELLADDTRLARLSADGAARARRTRDILLPLIALHGRLDLRSRLERAWLQLGGAALLPDAAAAGDVAALFDLIETLEAGEALTPDTLEAEIARLYAAPLVGDAVRVQLMTSHKAKGLEFDVVILPGLERRPRGADKALLQWMALPRADGEAGLLIAPVGATGGEKDPLYAYVAALHQEKAAFEAQRLLYVAATRARRRLHLCAVASVSTRDGARAASPPANSLLALLWDELAPHFAALALPPEGEAADLALPPPRALRRVSAGWRPDAAAVAALSESPDLASAAMAADAPDPLDGAEAAAVGTAAHLLLEHLARDGELSAADARLDTMTPLLHRRLARLGLAPAGAQRATERALALVRTSLRDADCRWLLSAHPVSRSEWPLGEAGPAGSAVHIIDRYFETAEGERWIIDYKTDTPPRDVAQAEFIAQRMEAHRPQLERYRRLASELDPRPLRLAIYFLALPALVELSA
jgi:ATP-dependent exoDNAse (exonuclease V) beta subunit